MCGSGCRNIASFYILPYRDNFIDAVLSFTNPSLRVCTMRGFAYVIAVMAALGIMIGIVSYPNQNEPVNLGPPTTPSPAVLMTESGTLTIAVPTMHCEVACFPRVKTTLEDAVGVQSVELAGQQKEGLIDNRQVIVHYDTGFNLNAALTSLAEEGFTKSTVVD
jgi:periplasmic mercuric ion binding protein